MMNRVVMAVFALAMMVSSAIAQPKFDRIVTNGELTAGKEFHLLLIHDGGQYSQQIASMLTQPRAQMIDWVRSSNVRLMHQSESQVMEHHADLVQKHQGQGMPIFAMIQQTADDGRGAVWCSAAGQQVPITESAMASWLGRYFQATAVAATQANQLAVVAGPRNLQQTYGGGSYFLPRSSGGAPEPYSPTGGRRPLINPQLDVTVPDTLNTQVGLNPETRQVLIIVGVLSIVCCLLLGASPIISAVIIGHAITDDDNPSAPTASP